ncbi:MAG TPA: hypothetical protein PKE04_12995 [Clostridia bacterium]|nr:hypothetical protein [Clostridia bacterium]
MKRFVGLIVLALALVVAATVLANAASQGGSAEYEKYLANPLTPSLGNSYVAPSESGAVPEAPAPTQQAVEVTLDTCGDEAEEEAPVVTVRPATAAPTAGSFSNLNSLPEAEVDACNSD